MNKNSTAFGAPGIEPRWTSSAKDGIGTAYHSASCIWFMLSHGIINEIYFPHVGAPNTRDLQFFITDGESFCHEERRDLLHKTEYPEQHALFYRLTNSDREGDTKNSEVVKDLLTSIQERGFTLHYERLLAVIDGAKALKKALRQVFGERVVIQRCWLHKERNLRASLPDRVHGTLHWRMKKLMSLNALSDARKELAALREWVAKLSADSAASLDEGGEELLALHGLDITGELRKSVASTNVIASLFAVVPEKIERVKNWKGRRSKQILRWVASAIVAHRTKMRRVRGMIQAGTLLTALGLKPLVAQAACDYEQLVPLF